MIPGWAVLSLYHIAITGSLPALPFEDAYITGIVASKLNLPRKSMKGHVYLNDKFGCDILKLDLCWYHKYSVFWQGINDTSMVTAWTQIKSLDVDAQCSKFSWHYFYSFVKYYSSLLFGGHKVCVLN